MLHSKELVAVVERETREVYKTPAERAAYRAGLSTAAAACDYASKEYGSRTVLKRAEAAAAKLCGDMIFGLRGMIRVSDSENSN